MNCNIAPVVVLMILFSASFGLIAGSTIGTARGVAQGKALIRAEAVKLGFGSFKPTDGSTVEFQWRGHTPVGPGSTGSIGNITEDD